MSIDQFAAPIHREEYRLRLAQACEELAAKADAGSDHQLAFARVFVGNATTNAQLETVAGLLDGTTTWDGLKIDTDLRWSLLRTLVSNGIRGDVEIDAELEVDNTATGRRQATLALASRPTMQAKDAAWDAVMHNNTLPNTIIEATIGGFQDPDHRDLMEAFVDRYFEELPGVWEEQTMEMAQDITSGMYPVYATSPELITKTNEFLAKNSMPTMIRLVTEGRDGAERALRAQAKDA
jgi:aminopeptidase N